MRDSIGSLAVWAGRQTLLTRRRGPGCVGAA
jgi:hypothetical protein